MNRLVAVCKSSPGTLLAEWTYSERAVFLNRDGRRPAAQKVSNHD
jgi:hypothetical protein